VHCDEVWHLHLLREAAVWTFIWVTIRMESTAGNSMLLTECFKSDSSVSVIVPLFNKSLLLLLGVSVGPFSFSIWFGAHCFVVTLCRMA
jgi:hypothetical protein